MPYESLQTTYPIKLYTLETGMITIPFPATNWAISNSTIENVQQSEGGTDIVQVVRQKKAHISAQFRVSDVEWVKKFLDLSMQDGIELSQYDPITDDYETLNVRMRNVEYSNVRKSQLLTGVKGVWDVSFELEEF